MNNVSDEVEIIVDLSIGVLVVVKVEDDNKVDVIFRVSVVVVDVSFDDDVLGVSVNIVGSGTVEDDPLVDDASVIVVVSVANEDDVLADDESVIVEVAVEVSVEVEDNVIVDVSVGVSMVVVDVSFDDDALGVFVNVDL